MQEVYEKFRDILKDRFEHEELRHTSQKTFNSLLSGVKQKVGFAGFSRLDLDPEKSGGFDRALYCLYPASSRNNRFIIASNSATQEMEIIAYAFKRDVTEPEQAGKISRILAYNRKDPLSVYNDRHLGFPVSGKIHQYRIPSVDILNTLLNRAAESSRTLSGKILNNKVRRFSLSREGKTDFVSCYERVYGDLLQQNTNELLEQVSHFINEQALVWAGEAVEKLHSQNTKKHNQITAYNHIVRAENTEAQKYRYQALTQIAPLGSLFIEEDMWKRIDAGEAPLSCLAETLSVKPDFSVKASTLKRIAAMPEVFSHGEELTAYAKFLENIQHQYWPATKEEFSFFSICLSIANLYLENFNKDPLEMLSLWNRQHKLKKSAPGEYWRDMACRLLQSTAREMEKSDDDAPYNWRPPNPDRIWDRIWAVTLSRLRSNMRNVLDMKNDVEARLINPLLLLSLEKQGYKPSEREILDTMVESVRKKLWDNMLPSEQIAASSYWHSPRVNISRRFQSAAINFSQNNGWQGLSDGPITLSNGVVAHPLTTSEALQEEADAMGHCVWSYSRSCLAGNSRILSLRDQNGKRLSTLQLIDFFDKGTRKRQVKIAQNQGMANRKPSSLSQEAANILVKEINNGSIRPDWYKIDLIRSDYKLKSVENEVGYDFRNDKEREAVFKVYEPCLPRKSGRSPAELAAHIGVDAIVRDFVEAYDLEQGGLVRIQDHQHHDAPQARAGLLEHRAVNPPLPAHGM